MSVRVSRRRGGLEEPALTKYRWLSNATIRLKPQITWKPAQGLNRVWPDSSSLW